MNLKQKQDTLHQGHVFLECDWILYNFSNNGLKSSRIISSLKGNTVLGIPLYFLTKSFCDNTVYKVIQLATR